ncbi:hypothetical protein MMC13_002292 [Lambiella insularis]|nr:hypothetical protein [Lambiella insularis]
MPNDLRMISGDTFQRNFTWPNPDPPMPWTGPDASQAALAQKAIGFNCLNYKMAPEPSLYRHFLPTKAYIDANCLDGLRLELLFPQCWNGSLDSTDHKSHLAFPSANLGGGSCPQGYDQLINQIFYETIYDTTRFAQQSGQFALANGDPTGYGYHGDIIVAWDEGVLANATAVCGPDTDPTDIGYSGITESCPVFDINLTSEMDSCKAALPVDLSSLNVTGPMPALPLNNRVQFGPAYATRPSATTSSEPSSTTPLPVASSAGPTLSYSSASSEASSPQADLMVLSTPSTISSTSASTVSTSVSPLGPALNAVATSFTTIGDVVHENIVVEVTELVTICVTDTVFATPTVVAKRNQHMHHHKHYNRHAW